jgi:hypothetical protein
MLLHGGGLSASLGGRCPEDGHGRRQRPQFLGRGVRRLRRDAWWVGHQRALGVCQRGLDAREITSDQPDPDQVGAKQWALPDHVGRQGGQPFAQLDVASLTPQVRQHRLDEVGSVGGVATGQGMSDRVLDHRVGGIPLARSPMEQWNAFGSFRSQARSERLGEQMVVPVPLAVVVERDDEHVCPVQRLELGVGVVASRDPVAQRPAQLAQH